MNFLAHLYLSPANDEIMIGNFIADAIKGKQKLKYSQNVQRGIKLHHHIDDFTDEHSVFKQSASRLKEKYRMYSNVIVDIYYDHFLAKNWNYYSDNDLAEFSLEAYRKLVNYYKKLPPRNKRILPYMIAQNWLCGYASKWSLKRVFYGMDRRTSFKSGMSDAVDDLTKHYNDYEEEFNRFFPEIINFVRNIKY